MGYKSLKFITQYPRIKAGTVLGVMMLPIALTIAGCSGASTKTTIAPEDSPVKLYSEADTALASGKFERAAKKFEEVDRVYPYSKLARKSIIMSSYAYYKKGDYAKAVAAAGRYIKLHPGTKESPLAYHIIASAYFDQVKGPRRDQGISKKALLALKNLVQRYPRSKYVPRARNRIRIVSDIIAASEMNVGRYYLKRSNYQAAINRFKYVVTNYQTTQQVEEALYRLTEGYLALGVGNEAQTAAAVLGHNFPRSKWYKDAYALLQKNNLTPKVDEGSWINRAWSTTVQSARS